LPQLITNGQELYTVCFRPDLPGRYVMLLTAVPANFLYSECPITSTTVVNVPCNNAPIPRPGNNRNIQLSRSMTSPNRVLLDGSGSHDPDNDFLTYQWSQIAGPTVIVDDWRAATSSVILPQAYAAFTFQLLVSDGCQAISAPVTYVTTCDTVLTLPVNNATLFSAYNGEVPVPLMTMGYDYAAALAAVNPAPVVRCEAYQFTLVDYVEQTAPLPPPVSTGGIVPPTRPAAKHSSPSSPSVAPSPRSLFGIAASGRVPRSSSPQVLARWSVYGG